jgi:hypothetical protein
LNRTPRTTRRRARLEASLNGLLFLFAVWLGAIRAYSYEINPIFCDGIDDHVGALFSLRLAERRDEGLLEA